MIFDDFSFPTKVQAVLDRFQYAQCHSNLNNAALKNAIVVLTSVKFGLETETALQVQLPFGSLKQSQFSQL